MNVDAVANAARDRRWKKKLPKKREIIRWHAEMSITYKHIYVYIYLYTYIYVHL